MLIKATMGYQFDFIKLAKRYMQDDTPPRKETME